MRGLTPLVLTCGLAGCPKDGYEIGRYLDTACEGYPDAILCSGFERPDLAEWSETVVAGTAAVQETEAMPHRGLSSLQATSLGEESVAVVAREFPPVLEGDLFFRAYFYVPSGTPTQTMNVLFLGDFATPDPFRGIDFNLEGDAPQIYVPQSQPQRFTSTSLVIPRDRWFCFRAHVALSAGAGAVQIEVDDAVALDQQGLDTLPAAGVHLLRAGIDWSSLQNDSFAIYIDDLVLATTPVPCD